MPMASRRMIALRVTGSLSSVGVVRDLAPCRLHNTVHCLVCSRTSSNSSSQGRSRSCSRPCGGPVLHSA